MLPDQTVIVQAGRISEIGPAQTTDVPSGFMQVDATGRYLIPALSDMHIHLESEGILQLLAGLLGEPEEEASAGSLD